MASFLLNDKMSPALRRRITNRLGGRSGYARIAPTGIALLRVAAVAVIIGSVVTWSWMRRQMALELSAAQGQLAARLAAAGEGLTPEARRLEQRLQPWFSRATSPFQGEFREPQLKDSRALSKLLQRSAVYVRGPIGAFGTPTAVRRSAAESKKDALLYCLLSPPSEPSEVAMLPLLGGGENAEAARHVERLSSALAGLPLLSDEWQRRVAQTEFVEQVRQLSELVAQAPLTEARRAALAELFILALDEPKLGDGPTEFDGSNRHFVRVFIVDLSSGSLLLRARRQVDPTWISERHRQRNANALTSCRLAYELHNGKPEARGATSR